MVSTSVYTQTDVAETLIRVAEHGEGGEAGERFDKRDAIAMATHGGKQLGVLGHGQCHGAHLARKQTADAHRAPRRGSEQSVPGLSCTFLSSPMGNVVMAVSCQTQAQRNALL